MFDSEADKVQSTKTCWEMSTTHRVKNSGAESNSFQMQHCYTQGIYITKCSPLQTLALHTSTLYSMVVVLSHSCYIITTAKKTNEVITTCNSAVQKYYK